MVARIRKDKFFIGYSTVGKRVPETRLYDIELIKRDILNHFMTRKGERVMNPEFGSIVWDLLFEPFTETVRLQIVEDVKNIIAQEPRVNLVDLVVEEDDHGITVQVLLNYEPFNLTEPLFATFYRDSSGRQPNDFIGEL